MIGGGSFSFTSEDRLGESGSESWGGATITKEREGLDWGNPCYAGGGFRGGDWGPRRCLILWRGERLLISSL